MLLAPLCALAALALAATPAHAVQLGLEEPHSPNAETISTAYWVMIAIVFAVIIAVNAALIAAIVRFRDRRGREPSRFTAARGALRPVVAALSVLALAIFVFGVVATEDAREIEPSGPEGLASTKSAQVGVKGVPPLTAVEGEQSSSGAEPASGEEPAQAAPLQIDAIAQQWVWRFEYPGGQPGQRTFSYGQLTVPVDTTVILNVRSTDVLHSWWVPALGGQVQAAPGEVTQTWFKADEVGRYAGRSTIFSGSAYPVMRSWVNVVPATDYEAYVSDLGADLNEAQTAVEQQNSETLQDPVGSAATPEASE
jgi:cytochrome c oxidase subunit 2